MGFSHTFFRNLFLHLGHVTSIFPTPFGTRILALHFLQRKYLWVLRLRNASLLTLNHEVILFFVLRNFKRSPYRLLIFLEYIRNMEKTSKKSPMKYINHKCLILDRKVNTRAVITKNKLYSSLPYLPIINCLYFMARL